MRGTMNMRPLAQVARKIDVRNSDWMNLIAFVQSCYGYRVRNYDLDAAIAVAPAAQPTGGGQPSPSR